MFKELEIMKTLRYLLIAVAMVSVLGIYAQSFAQKPEPKMQSTSGMMYSGSNLPQAAATGATLAEEPRVQSSGRPGHIRRDENPFGDQTIENTDNPNEPGTPLGDVFWPLMLLACAYTCLRVFLKKRVLEGR